MGAYIIFTIGALISLYNFFLSFVRPLLYSKKKETYRFVSGVPLFGSLLLVLSLLGVTDPLLRRLGIVIALLDTGGLHWFLATMVWQKLRSELPNK